MNKYSILQIIGILADIITVLSIWGFGSDSPLILRIVVTILIFVATGIYCFIQFNNNDLGKVIDYILDDDNEISDIILKRNNNYVDDTLVGIYITEEKCEKLIGVGKVIKETNVKYKHIKVIKLIDEDSMRKIYKNTSNINKYFTKSIVRYEDLKSIGLINV